MRESLEITAPHARTLDLRAGGPARRSLLAGPPESAGMRSGLVVLAAGESVGRHTTGSREEAIVVLEGRGELRVDGAAPLVVDTGTAAYVPPGTGHDVANPGETTLRYVYVVAEASGAGAIR